MRHVRIKCTNCEGLCWLNRSYSTKTGSKHQQYICKKCKKTQIVAVQNEDKPFRRLKMLRRVKIRVRKAIALWASGLSREEVQRRTGVDSETIKRNAHYFIDSEDRDALDRYILRHYRFVKDEDMFNFWARIDAFSRGYCWEKKKTRIIFINGHAHKELHPM